ncbi:AIPR family protein [Capnocytophaga stomatis]|uniref:AIPR family protein n=1 Tax=Capnocytophaga stomatis TaxID=1848904 RepID=UPI00385B4357
MKPKIERYITKFIDNNFDRKDRKKGDSIKFEWFVNSLHTWEYSSQSYNSKANIGKEISLGTAQGGDAFFLLIGSKIYSLSDSIDEIKNAIRENNNKIGFHLIQTKKSHKADLGDFKMFVEVPIKVIKNEGIKDTQKELNQLVKFIQAIKDNPELEASFVLTFYTEKDENDINKLRKDWEKEIEYIQNQYAEYGDVKIYLEGSKKLNDLYEQFNSNDYKLIIPKTNCMYADNYLFGFITAKELLDCIAPFQNNNIRALYPDVFKNNIRLYLGPTEVNQKIEKTLIEESNKFHLYNNGLTITTKEIKPVLENFVISPINIVNGCQTANSIYNTFKENNKAVDIDKVKIPVKIVVANDEEYEKITIRTNSQNGISEKDLLSISNIQKDLEESLSKNQFMNKTFLYKRQNSSDSSSNEKIDYIVTINDILRSFLSAVLYMPHKVSGYFDITTGKLIDIVFEDRFIKLYQIIVAVYKTLGDYIESDYPQHKKLRYHLLYLLYKFVNNDANIDDIERYFIKEKNKNSFEELQGEDLAEQNKVIDKIYSNLYNLSKEDNFQKTVKHIIDIIENKYPNLINLDTKEKERILYKTVDKNQRGEKVFNNFENDFILQASK